MTEPTDAEIIAVMRDGYNCRYNDEADHIDFARAVLAKWGTPPTVAGKPVMWAYQYSDGSWHDASATEHSAGMKPLYATPQPTQAQAGACEPLTDEHLRVIERMHVYAHTATLMDFARAIERAHGIKGGQHGTE